MAQDLYDLVIPQTSLSSQGMKQDEALRTGVLGWTKGLSGQGGEVKIVCGGGEGAGKDGEMTSITFPITFLSLSCFPESLEPK